MKILKVTFILFLMFMIVGCSSTTEEKETENQEQGYEQEETENQEQGWELEETDRPRTDVEGKDPQHVQRYESAIRYDYLEDSYVSYYAQATKQDLINFYQKLADERNQTLNYDLERDPNLFFVIDLEDSSAQDSFGFTINKEEDGYIYWTVTAAEW